MFVRLRCPFPCGLGYQPGLGEEKGAVSFQRPLTFLGMCSLHPQQWYVMAAMICHVKSFISDISHEPEKTFILRAHVIRSGPSGESLYLKIHSSVTFLISAEALSPCSMMQSWDQQQRQRPGVRLRILPTTRRAKNIHHLEFHSQAS